MLINKSVKYLLSVLLMIVSSVTAQSGSARTAPWHGKKCAVVLTYDDALNVHLDHVVPLLDSLDLRATFYISGSFPGFKQRIDDWRAVARKGNELGNHTLFHPCNGQLPGRDWVQPDYDLSKYTVQRMVDEVRVTNILLEAIDGKKTRTFAYTCGDMKIGDVSFIDQLKNDVAAARAVRSEMHTIDQVDLYNMDSYMINGESGDQLISLVKKAMASKALLIFLFHGVGGEHDLNVSLKAHSKLLHFLKDNEDQVWTTTMLDMATYIRNYRKANKSE